MSAVLTWLSLSQVCWQVFSPGAEMSQYSEEFILKTTHANLKYVKGTNCLEIINYSFPLYFPFMPWQVGSFWSVVILTRIS
jgi:hypothetical protein